MSLSDNSIHIFHPSKKMLRYSVLHFCIQKYFEDTFLLSGTILSPLKKKQLIYPTHHSCRAGFGLRKTSIDCVMLMVMLMAKPLFLWVVCHLSKWLCENPINYNARTACLNVGDTNATTKEVAREPPHFNRQKGALLPAKKC